MTDRIKQDINALVEQPRQPRTLPPVEPVGGIPAGRGIAPYLAGGGGGGGGGGGIASPLTEVSRTYHPDDIVMSIDGVIAVAIRRTKEMNMTDANGDPVVMEFL